MFIPSADGEQKIKPIKDKYTITKNAVWILQMETTDTIQIDLIDLQNSVESELGAKNLDIIISDFIPTSKGRLSNANDILSSQNIILQKVKNANNGLETRTEEEGKEIQFIQLKDNLTQFTITTNTTEKDTITYSGKIYLKNESVSIPIDVDVVIKHNPLELIIFNFIGIAMGIGSAITMTRERCSTMIRKFGVNVEFNNSKGPWILVVLTTIVGIPSSLLVNNLFIGNVGWDVIIALGIGFLILVGLLKERKNNFNDNLKIEFELPNTIKLEDKKDKLESVLNENYSIRGWFDICKDELIKIQKRKI